MKKILVFITSLVLLVSGFSNAYAVENGLDESGNPFVVPISTTISATRANYCSGTLIAPTVAVTAGHCVVDANGLVSKEVFVGQAGSSFASIASSDLVKSVEITSTYRSGLDNRVGDDDLAFLVLSKSQNLSAPIRLASESEITSFKNAGTALKAVGYGYYSDSGSEKITFPKSFTGVYSSIPSTFANSALLKSTVANSCAGDSGAPIMVSTPSTVILVGILSGSSRNVHCANKAPDGAYYTLFTLISRYSNLAFASALTSINGLRDQVSSAQAKIDELNSQISTLEDDAVTASNDLSNSQEQIVKLQAEVKALQAKLPSSLTCVKGKITKKVTGINPKCPTGYKPKV